MVVIICLIRLFTVVFAECLEYNAALWYVSVT